MRKLALQIVLLFFAGTHLTAQTPQQISTTCATLARLTAEALQRNDAQRVVLYVQTARAIRTGLNDSAACEAAYFASVVNQNQAALASATTVIAINFVQPVPGWKHSEIQELIRLSKGDGLSDVIQQSRIDKDLQPSRMKLNRNQIENLGRPN
ncbi:MAG: hypothetical protein ICV87_00525 [Gemmatimonadetes bacterium]|nr:hypothetical protein [Gemmatimonadota bacterium]